MATKKFFLANIILLPFFFSAVPIAYAETIEVTVSGNGADSENRASVEVEEDVNVEQENQAEIENDIQVEGDTGNNSAEGNSGDTEIETGDAGVEIVVENEDINQNIAETDEDTAQVTVEICGNGAGSETTVEVTQEEQKSIVQKNSAEIKNSIRDEVNTGGNSIVDSGGEAEITTGNIESETAIVNEDINLTATLNTVNSGGCCSEESCHCREEDEDEEYEEYEDPEIDVGIFGNGADSENVVRLLLESETKIESKNEAEIENCVGEKLSTGGNRVLGSCGSVQITAGNITKKTTIKNNNINCSKVKKQEPMVEPDEPVVPPGDGDEPTDEEEEPEKPHAPPSEDKNGDGEEYYNDEDEEDEDKDKDVDGDKDEDDGEVLGVTQLPVTGQSKPSGWKVLIGLLAIALGTVFHLYLKKYRRSLWADAV